MKLVQKMFSSAYVLIVVMFFISAITLVIFSLGELWNAISAAGDGNRQSRFVSVLECIGLLTIAVAALELGQTILEEEVQRSSSISAPTRVRRFLSRFIVVVVVALSIECLVAVFQFIHDAPELLPQAASVGVAAAALLAAWGLFVKLNIAAETLEPEAMKTAKQEDVKVDASNGEQGKAENPTGIDDSRSPISPDPAGKPGAAGKPGPAGDPGFADDAAIPPRGDGTGV
jgi:hypothetical protein